MGGVKFVYVLLFFLDEQGTQKQNFPGNLRTMLGQSRDNPGITPGQSRENLVCVFSCLLVLFPAVKLTEFGPQNCAVQPGSVAFDFPKVKHVMGI